MLSGCDFIDLFDIEICFGDGGQSAAVICAVAGCGDLREPAVYKIHFPARVLRAVRLIEIDRIIAEHIAVSPAFDLLVNLKGCHDLRVLPAVSGVVMDTSRIACDIHKAACVVFAGHAVAVEGAAADLGSGGVFLDVDMLGGDVLEYAVFDFVGITVIIKAGCAFCTADIDTLAVAW